ncbi:MAG: YidC/Oxa1 family membrane protein insertase [Streptococcaceae bacterium]|jgi:YidC/Oxa1 family membrane protein insertase|nr:YidC/Oxa1 family membrane protein insertase [Streptococcaceae bacterium]
MKKRTKYLVLIGFVLLFLTGCGRGDLSASTPGAWNQLVYLFGRGIEFLSFNGYVGLGIIIFTIIVKTALLPLMHIQMKSMRKMQELQPEIKKIQKKYPDKDTESRRLVGEETQQLYRENKVNPSIGCLPMLIQMPILLALYQALTRMPSLRHGHFLGFDIAAKDPYYILPILAAVFTFLSSWLSMKSTPEQNAMTKSMTYVMPVMIFMFSISVASGVSLYWGVSNAYQVFQVLLLNNPFKLQKERDAKRLIEREKEKKIRKAKRKIQKKK